MPGNNLVKHKIKKFRDNLQFGIFLFILPFTTISLHKEIPDRAFVILLLSILIAFIIRYFSTYFHGSIYNPSRIYEFILEILIDILLMIVIIYATFGNEWSFHILAFLAFFHAGFMLLQFFLKAGDNPIENADASYTLSIHYIYLVAAAWRLFVAFVIILFFFITNRWNIKILDTDSVFVVIAIPMAEVMESVLRQLYYGANHNER